MDEEYLEEENEQMIDEEYLEEENEESIEDWWQNLKKKRRDSQRQKKLVVKPKEKKTLGWQRIQRKRKAAPTHQVDEKHVVNREVESEEKVDEAFIKEETREKIVEAFIEEESQEKMVEEYLDEENIEEAKERKTEAAVEPWWQRIKKKQLDVDADIAKEDEKDEDFEPSESSEEYDSDDHDEEIKMLRRMDKARADKERRRECAANKPLPADITTLYKKIDDALRGRDPIKRTYYECVRCLAFFRTESAVHNHILHRRCEADQRGSNVCITADDVRLDEDNTYVCLHCYRRYRYLSDMKHHIKRRHFLTNQPTCSECSQTFPNKSLLLNHKVEAHGIDERFHCTACSSSLTTAGALKNHMESVHMLDMVKCSKCDYEGFGARNLKRHMETHDTVTKACRFCVKTFTNRGCLDQHERIHTRQGVKQCKHCEASFVQLSSFRAHMVRRHPNHL